MTCEKNTNYRCRISCYMELFLFKAKGPTDYKVQVQYFKRILSIRTRVNDILHANVYFNIVEYQESTPILNIYFWHSILASSPLDNVSGKCPVNGLAKVCAKNIHIQKQRIRFGNPNVPM